MNGMDYDEKSSPAFFFGTGTCLEELDASSLEALSQAANRRSYEKGQIVCLEGEPCPGLIIIEAGWLSSVKISPLGREQEIRLVGPGEMLNEISLMAGDVNLVTLKSLESSTIWVVEPQNFFLLMAQHPKLSSIMMQNLSRLLVQLLGLVEDLSLRNVEGRLAHLLLKRSKDGVVQREYWSTQDEMAARIGTTSVVISRMLNEMQTEGAIHLDRRQIRILDQEKLEKSAFFNHK
jgi:CRP/FNR family transcriptional regulator, cyclic AMP receptor protein